MEYRSRAADNLKKINFISLQLYFTVYRRTSVLPNYYH